jgi:Icc-related predicted phosphoesterase
MGLFASKEPITAHDNFVDDAIWQEVARKHGFKVEDLEIKYPPLVKESDDNKIRIVCISDTHSKTDQENLPIIPDGDILIHSGDFTDAGAKDEVIKFNEWLGTLPHEHKIVIAGNHEYSFDPNCIKFKKLNYDAAHADDMKKELTNCVYLEDSEIVIRGLKIYGSPWQPKFGSGNSAFNVTRGAVLKEKWDKIPDDIDILITHGPPLGYGDNVGTPFGNVVRAGCKDLLFTIKNRVKPKLHVYGHIHEGIIK